MRAERRLGRRLKQENQKKQEVFKLRSVVVSCSCYSGRDGAGCGISLLVPE